MSAEPSEPWIVLQEGLSCAFSIMPSQLGPALQAHYRELFGDDATLYPHRGPTAAPLYVQTEPGKWFSDLPRLATIRGAIEATHTGTTHVGMGMAPAHDRAPGQYSTRVASGVGRLPMASTCTWWPKACGIPPP